MRAKFKVREIGITKIREVSLARDRLKFFAQDKTDPPADEFGQKNALFEIIERVADAQRERCAVGQFLGDQVRRGLTTERNVNIR